MKSVTINLIISNQKVSVNVHENEDYNRLKEVLRDKLTPIVGDQNWGKIKEIIRDTAAPYLC